MIVLQLFWKNALTSNTSQIICRVLLVKMKPKHEKTQCDNGRNSSPAAVEELMVEDGVYRPEIARELAEIGAKLKDDALRSQADAVAAKQTDYVAEAVRLGAMLEAKWAAICNTNNKRGLIQFHRVDTRTKPASAKESHLSLKKKRRTLPPPLLRRFLRPRRLRPSPRGVKASSVRVRIET